MITSSITISSGGNKFSKNFKVEKMPWPQFVARCQKPRRTPETMAQYDAMSTEDRDKIKNGPCFVGGIVEGGQRLKGSITARTLITLDADHVGANGEHLARRMEAVLGQITYIVYETHSSRTKKPKYRIVILPDRPMSVEEHEAAARWIAAQIGMEFFDRSTFEANRLMYFPSCSKDADPVIQNNNGQPLNIDAILGEYEDWLDAESWPRHADDKPWKPPRTTVGTLQDDPRQKGGAIGAFCQTYTISQAIVHFLPDKYIPATENRYTYAVGKGVRGLYVIDDLLAYSHHGSDPCYAQMCNAFDLVRIHKFSDKDNGKPAETKMADLPSFKTMLQLCGCNENVKKLIVSTKLTDLGVEQQAGTTYGDLNQRLNDRKYIINKDGQLCSMRFDKNTQEAFLVPIADFVAWIEKQIIRDNGIEQTLRFTIRGLAQGGRKLKATNVQSKEFRQMGWPSDNWGKRAKILPGMSNRDHLRYVVEFLGEEAPEETQYVGLGWREIEDKWVYLHAGGAIGADNVIVDLTEEGLNTYRLPEAVEDVKTAAEASYKALQVAPLEVTLPLFALAYLAPLCEPLRQAGIEPSFVVWLSGTTGSLKSTLAALFLSHFGKFSSRNLPCSFKDTANSIERKGFFTKDSILCVDDYHPTHSQNEATKMRSIAEQLLRGYGDRVGRARLNADATAKRSYIPRGLCLVTGEDLPGGGQSAAARYFGLTMEREDVDLAILTELQGQTNLLGQAMANCIGRINIEQIKEGAAAEFSKLRNKATQNNQHARLPEVVAWLTIGLKSGLAFMVNTGVINKNEANQMLEQGEEIFLQLAERQAKNIEAETPVELFRNAMIALLGSKEINVRLKNDCEFYEMRNLVGWEDEEFYYLMPGPIYNAINKFYQTRGGHMGISDYKLWEHLDMAGHLIPSQEEGKRRRVMRRKFDGKRQTIIRIKHEFLDPKEDSDDITDFADSAKNENPEHSEPRQDELFKS